MTIYVVETFVVKPDKADEWASVYKKYLALIKKHPDLHTEVKSYKVFNHWLGGSQGGTVVMWEMESIEDIPKRSRKLSGNKEFTDEIYPNFLNIMVPRSYSVNVWTPFQ
jgi:hypothetical protein